MVDREKGCYALMDKDEGGLTLLCPKQVIEDGKTVTKLLETHFSSCKKGDQNGYR